MKPSKLSMREVIAVAIAVAALAGLLVMLTAELNILPGTTAEIYQGQVLPSLKRYSMALGVILLVVSISYILLGREEDISTRLDDPNK